MAAKTNNRKEKYYAFFDAEYTCYMESDINFDRNHGSEVLSIGLVISDKNFNVMRTFYSAIRPVYNPRLTRYCKALTGLTQREIDLAPSYEEVFQKLFLLFQEYPVKEIFAWGNDYQTLCNDIEKNHNYVPKKYKRIVYNVCDLTKRLTTRVFGRGMSVSLSDMKYICNMEHRTAHNAYEDAKDLYKITKCCVQNTYNKERARKLDAYIQHRDRYHQYRRFKHSLTEIKKPESAKRELKKVSIQYIETLKHFYEDKQGTLPPEIAAMCDDVLGLMGQQGRHCPKLEE